VFLAGIQGFFSMWVDYAIAGFPLTPRGNDDHFPDWLFAPGEKCEEK
jgi:hypothetical protein